MAGPCGGDSPCADKAKDKEKDGKEKGGKEKVKFVKPKEVETCEMRIQVAQVKTDPEAVVKEGTKIRDLDAIELLDLGNDDRPRSELTKYWPEIIGVYFGLTTGAGLNFATRRPIFSGIQKYAVTTVFWLGSVKLFDRWRKNYYIEKDAVLRHYIEQHPNDWPPLTPKNRKELPPRKKFGDALYLEKWAPIR